MKRGFRQPKTRFDMRNHPGLARRVAFFRDGTAALITYRTLSDIAGKAAFFAVTVLAARSLSRDAFGIMALGTTLGWMAAVATDFGLQMHLARAVALRPGAGRSLLDTWLGVRLWIAAIVLALVAVVIAAAGMDRARGLPLLIFVAAYVVNGLIEFLHYFYRGLSRSDIESTLTLAWRGGSLACAAVVLWWDANVNVLGLALLLPGVLGLFAAWHRSALPWVSDGA
jgi:O-antigen/teichoic acid export membrane protein